MRRQGELGHHFAKRKPPGNRTRRRGGTTVPPTLRARVRRWQLHGCQTVAGIDVRRAARTRVGSSQPAPHACERPACGSPRPRRRPNPFQPRPLPTGSPIEIFVQKSTRFLGDLAADFPLKDSMGRGAKSSMGRGVVGFFGDIMRKPPPHPFQSNFWRHVPTTFWRHVPSVLLSGSSAENFPKKSVYF